MNLSGKLRVGAAFLLVFLLILATNRLDQHHYETVQTKITSVYKDRVLAQHYVYQISGIVHEQVQKVRYEASTDKAEMARLDSLMTVFRGTKLTQEEGRVLERLQRQLNSLNTISAQLVSEPDAVRLSNQELVDVSKQIRSSLDRLSAIQQEESWNLKKAAQISLDRNSFVSRAELLALAIIAVLVQIIIFYRPSKD